MKKNLLITGGAGFIGSHFVELALKKAGVGWHIINLDKITYAADKTQIEHLEGNPNYTFIHADICDVDAMRTLFQETPIHSVIHFAAESHVDNSISGPRVFLETNILGTQNLLEAARHTWLSAPHKLKSEFKDSRFHHISTDEVYGTLSFTDPPFTEETPYAPNSPYSASKASSDFMVRAYAETYGLPMTMTNCSNNYGSRQHDEKLIPTIVRCALQEQPLPIYGDGKNVRDWLYVSDHCSAIWEVFTRGDQGETYNVGGNAERNNLAIVKEICSNLDIIVPRSNGESYEALLSFVKDRPGHDRRYAINATKLKEKLGWVPTHTFEDGIKETVVWYVTKYTRVKG
jgi:dTDP-glucose 4,6-dehydratase